MLCKPELLLRGMSILVVFFSAVTLLLGVFVPVYGDEVTMLSALGRVFAEGGDRVLIYPQCSESFVTPMQVFLWPGAAIYSAVFGNLTLFGIRLVGVVHGLLWFGGMAFLCFRIFRRREGALTCFGIICAVSFFGVLPFMWVLARVEGVFILCLLVLTGISVGSRPESRVYLKSFFLVAISSLFFYVHPKALFFFPFVVVAIFIALRRARSVLKYAVLVVVALTAAQSYIAGNLLMQCKDIPVLLWAFSLHAIPVSLLFDSPLAFLQGGVVNILGMPDRVVHHLLFSNTYQSGWLPPMQTSGLTDFINILVEVIIKALIVGALCSGVLKFFIEMLRRQITPNAWLAMGLSIGLIANAFLYNTWQFYGPQQVIAIVTLIALLTFSDVNFPLSILKVVRGLGVLLMATALASLVVLNYKLVPDLYRNSTSQLYPPPNQPLSVPHIDQEQNLEIIRALAKQCGLPASGTKNLVVDQMTYFAFSNLRQPIQNIYVTEHGFGGDLANGKLVPFLTNLGSPGSISSCSYMSSQFKSLRVAESNGYCCVAFGKDIPDTQTSRGNLK